MSASRRSTRAPATEWATVAQASDAHVDGAVRAAAKAFRSWRTSSLAERQELLWRLADRVAEAPYWPSMLAIENGRPIREAVMADVPVTADIFRYYAGLVRDHKGENIDAGRGAHLYTVREPLGADRGADPLELAADLDRAEARARARDGQHGRPQAVRVRRPERGRVRPADGRPCPAGCRQRRHRLRPERRRGARRASRASRRSPSPAASRPRATSSAPRPRT